MESMQGYWPVLRLLVLWTAFFAATSRAQDPAFQAELVTQGKELTAAYKECLGRFPPNLQEQLRIAQRAWIVFDNKNETAFAVVGKRKGMSAEDLDRAGLPETVARAAMLRAYFSFPDRDLPTLRQVAGRAEEELTTVYKQCIATLDREAEQKLREAERAWIDYRDKDVRAHLGDPSGRAVVWASIQIAQRRTAQLKEFYLQRAAALPTLAATPIPPPSPTPVRLDPAVRAKLTAEFREATQSVLAQATASGTFTEVSSFGEVKEVPAELSEAIVNLDNKATALRQRLGGDDRRDDCRTSLDIADTLNVFRKALEDIRAANAPGAITDFASYYDKNPAPTTDEQKTLRKSLDALRALCKRQEAQAVVHLQRARSAADAGKNGEATQEYQEAYRLFPDPDVAQAIKRLREDSLGL